MEVTYSAAVGAELREALVSTANADTVEGILLLAAPDPAFRSEMGSQSAA
jgi:hypothetical protein